MTVPEDTRPSAFDAIVVGAGFSGLYMLHRLRGLGLSATVLESGEGVGGTWYWNRYPGARCDSESWSYSYSFSPELEQEWTWAERYPSQPEMLRYLDHVADRFDLRRDIRFGTTVVAASFRDASSDWEVRTDGGDVLTARFLITAVGCLSSANVPDIPGRESFAGQTYHTGRWPHSGVDVTGRRVGVVGTGSTGIQVIPELAEPAAHLTVFQRTPNFSIPARNRPLSEADNARFKAHYRAIRRLQRSSTNGHPYLISDRATLSVPDDERTRIYQDGWDRGGLQFRAAFSDMMVDRTANDAASDFLRSKIREVVHDPATAQKLLPFDHPFAAKRPPIDTDYFETYNRDDVTLVDVRSDPITAITPTGIRTASGEHALDTIVFATGFDAMTGPLLRMDIRGREGLALSEKWAAGPRTYLGVATAGFPNLFTLTGPGSPSVLANMPTAIEQHVDWVAEALVHLGERGAGSIEAEPEAEDRWVEHVNVAADRTLLPLAGSSWYLGANVPGKPRVFMPYAGGLGAYTRLCDDVAARGYPGFVLGPASPT